jgi:hypothetical protein
MDGVNYTEADLTLIRAARLRGVRTVQFADRSVTYASDAEMRAVENDMRDRRRRFTLFSTAGVVATKNSALRAGETQARTTRWRSTSSVRDRSRGAVRNIDKLVVNRHRHQAALAGGRPRFPSHGEGALGALDRRERRGRPARLLRPAGAGVARVARRRRVLRPAAPAAAERRALGAPCSCRCSSRSSARTPTTSRSRTGTRSARGSSSTPSASGSRTGSIRRGPAT